MARGRRDIDAALLAALAGGATVQAAAHLAGVSAATVHRRLLESGFRQQLQKARADLIERACGHLASAAAEAAILLRNLLASDTAKDAVKVNAARIILDSALRLQQQVDVLERLDQLEQQLAAHKVERGMR